MAFYISLLKDLCVVIYENRPTLISKYAAPASEADPLKWGRQ